MKLKRAGEAWYFDFVSATVERVAIDYRFGLLIQDEGDWIDLVVSLPFDFGTPDGVLKINPEILAEVPPAIVLLHREVQKMTIDPDGHLKLCFEGNLSIDVEPNLNYEAWEFGSNLGTRLICGIGRIGVTIYSRNSL